MRSNFKVVNKDRHDNHQVARDVYVQTNLVSDIPGMAPNTDPNLQGAWGLSFSTTSPFWVSDQNANFKGSGATYSLQSE